MIGITEEQKSFLEELGIGTNDQWIMERVGIRSRRTLLDLDYIRQTHNRDLRAAPEASVMTLPELSAQAARMALERAGIDAPTKGAHQFRHALATQMLRHGASLTEIGELLGHRSPETTKIYAKVDLDALRTLALPWPGGVR